MDSELYQLLLATGFAASLTGLAAMALWRRREANRLRGQLALQSQRQQLTQRMLEISRHANDIVFLLDRQTNILDANDRAVGAYGYSLEELRRLKAIDLRAPQARAAFNPVMARLEDEKGALYETLHQRKAGTVFPVEISTRVFELDGEKFYQVFIRDITDRRKNEEQVRKLSRAVGQSPASILITDANGSIEYVNPKFCSLTGYSSPEVIGKNPRILKSGDLPAEAYRRLWETIQAGNEWRGEFRNCKKNGDLYWELASISPIRNADGKITHFLAVKEDITERKEAEQSLKLLGSAVEQSAEAVIIMEWAPDPEDARILFVNPAFTRLRGYTAEEVLGKNPRALSGRHADPEQLNRVRQTLARGEVFHDQATFLRKDGSELEMEWIITPLRDPKGAITHFVSVQRDISEQKQAEAELKALHQQLLQTARQAGMAEVATSVLHNVGNVLNSVVTSSSVAAQKVRNSKLPFLAKTAAMLRDNADNLPQFFASNPKAKMLPGYLTDLASRLVAEQSEIASELASLSQHIEHIKQIVAMQQSYARIGGVKELLSAKDLMEDALRFNASGFERRHIQVARDYADLPPINVEKHKVLQILVNLLSNAKNALDEASTAEKKIVLRTEWIENAHVRLSITDNGIGISGENLERLFQLGFTTRKEGHGFGLHNAALVAKELGGELRARSEGPGKGATFVLEIPCRPNS